VFQLFFNSNKIHELSVGKALRTANQDLVTATELSSPFDLADYIELFQPRGWVQHCWQNFQLRAEFKPRAEISARFELLKLKWNDYMKAKLSILGIILIQGWNFNSGNSKRAEISALDWTVSHGLKLLPCNHVFDLKLGFYNKTGLKFQPNRVKKLHVVSS
jgi:hypothetical protein